jgi:hypothetical protein
MVIMAPANTTAHIHSIHHRILVVIAKKVDKDLLPNAFMSMFIDKGCLFIDKGNKFIDKQ